MRQEFRHCEFVARSRSVVSSSLTEFRLCEPTHADLRAAQIHRKEGTIHDKHAFRRAGVLAPSFAFF